MTSHLRQKQVVSAYIHIPFCEHICYYCDFNKVFIEGQPVDEYVNLLVREMSLTMANYPDYEINTLYIGGGTPTSLTAKQLDRLLEGVHKYLPINRLVEFSVEANPGDIDKEKMAVLKYHGVNRLSMGVQSFHDEILKKIGRVHTKKDIFKSVDQARKSGFENISIDLIFRLPKQTIPLFKESLQQALSLDLPHYAVYSLILENKTVFYQLMRKGKLHLPSDDEDADMYELAMEMLDSAGRKQYEISNFALSGYESIHNKTYWQNGHYFGFGAGAHGYIEAMRYKNNGPIQHYLDPLKINQLPIFSKENLSKKQIMEEELFLGLRQIEGISQELFLKKYAIPVKEVYGQTIYDLIDKGLLEEKDGYIKLTKRGIFLGDTVFQSFLG
ncbi:MULTISPECIES: radical SAM family heme chaperone HemW [unclassified Granulicatella]|uniref:radical SAM family heme chaperone HemW n=1 Tax=unclassified Granulicatella TaxID=2630493 RepID=UPI00107321F4|nr:MULTISPECIES: radical SAM family heme chaperone HemW [unclassified Granulicatella]MBF0779730.1 oxygen-independent coproporphyrinogen III oxidase [Granulicatella sp. 19428wC4_WM01]TFU96249.1 oxygen-independent coproporphyrinogen III oxidase [Granulicatella sp. WM01]